MARVSKATLVKSLHEKGIPVPKGATIADLEKRMSWLSGDGWLVRRFRPVKWPDHPVMLLNHQETTWLPDTNFAKRIIMSQKVMVIGRAKTPPEGVAVLDVEIDEIGEEE